MPYPGRNIWVELSKMLRECPQSPCLSLSLTMPNSGGGTISGVPRDRRELPEFPEASWWAVCSTVPYAPRIASPLPMGTPGTGSSIRLRVSCLLPPGQHG